MRYKEAQLILQEVHNRQYWWLKEWGISTIKEAIRTIYTRYCATKSDIERAECIEYRIYRKW